MKNISILGSTGSIGRNTLRIIEMFPELFSVTALTAGSNIDLLARQIKMFRPELAVVIDPQHAQDLKKRLDPGIDVDIMAGVDGYKSAASHTSVDMVISAIVGAAGLLPTIAALEAGKEVALANKETLVMAGDIVMPLAEQKGVKILPVDSEHSAVFQCISGQRKEDISKIILTASGGPFRNKPAEDFPGITLSDALNHPTWDMGQKISIDSATLMNKGLEVIEAKYLFDVPVNQIEVVVHPQSIVHSMVSYIDGSVIAQLGIPDMKCAIAYAMSYPERLLLNQSKPDFAGIGELKFEEPDLEKFPCLSLAYKAGEEGHTFPAVLNAANETVVNAFLKEKIHFTQIPEIISKVMDRHTIIRNPALNDIIEADLWARENAVRMIEEK